ncbi:MAG: PIG-L family deacetylase, partial [Kiritimatiellae bacterium]|nr:PIG-L family deacetylase [Kiritimatiellia bacterium]
LALRLIDRGFKVKFVSMTDGRMGHHIYSPDETAKVRRKETLEAARRMKLDGYDIYGYPDCGLFPTDDARKNVARKIREYQPDYIITHRTCDYHADHRATGQLVTDACYLLGVPHWCPEVPAQRHRPVIFYMTDAFSNPRPIRPDLMFDVDNYIERLCDGLDAQGSQIYEWLPWDSGREKTVAQLGDRSDLKKRNEYIDRYTFGRKRADAKRFAEMWKERNPDAPLPKNLEVYEISEYGRRPSKVELKFLCE